MKKLLFVLLAGMLMLTGCGGGNDDKSGEAPKSNDESSTELSTKEVSAKLREINDWYVTDIWNVGLCDIGLLHFQRYFCDRRGAGHRTDIKAV